MFAQSELRGLGGTTSSRPVRGVGLVTIEYDGHAGTRERTTLKNHAARRLYATLLGDDRDPTVVSIDPTGRPPVLKGRRTTDADSSVRSDAMTTENTTAVETTVDVPEVKEPVKVAGPKARKAATAKVEKPPVKGVKAPSALKAVAKKVKEKAKAADSNGKGTGRHGVEYDKDLPWSEAKVAVLKALKRLKAVGATNARPTPEVAEKAGLHKRIVRKYCFAAKASGLTGFAKAEGSAAYGFYLTSKGASMDFDAELKAVKTKAVKE